MAKKKKQQQLKTWKPMAAGFFTVISASIAFGRSGDTMLAMVAPQLGLLDATQLKAVLIALGVVAMVGGIMALIRRSWGMALAVAIAATPLLTPLGALAVVWVVQSRQEFAEAAQWRVRTG